jgi:uncharacterized protein
VNVPNPDDPTGVVDSEATAVSRRLFLIGAAGSLATLAACSDSSPTGKPTSAPELETSMTADAQPTTTTVATAASTVTALGPGVIAAQVDHDRFEINPLPSSVRVDRDVMVTTPAGDQIALNLFRPEGDGPFPVVCALTSYGKDLHPIDYMLRGRGPTFRSIGLRMGEFSVSDATPFEAPDPTPWVAAGYAVAHVDALGTGNSSGQPGMALSPPVFDGFVTAIEWLADQPWSNGRVGLTGVSYLAIIQWYVAARRPRGLAAICPWEGMTDPFADAMFHGGIPETAFVPWWLGSSDTLGSDDPPVSSATRLDISETDFAGRLAAGMTPRRSAFPLPAPDLSAIDVPALICASWSAQGVHSRGAFEAWRRVGSPIKHLYTHGRHEWTVSNSTDAFDTQRAFFDRHVAERPDAAELPPVRLETRVSTNEYSVRSETAWPLPRTRTLELHLDSSGRLSTSTAAVGTVSYAATAGGSVRFTYRFDDDTELTGPAALRVWMSTDEGDDMDVFVVLRKLDAAGEQVGFWNLLQPNDVVTRGWLRASQRALDMTNTEELRPVLAYDGEQPVPRNEPIRLDVELLPSSTSFETGSSLVLEIAGQDIALNPMQQHHRLYNAGRHIVHTGDIHTSALLLPLVTSSSPGP